MERKTLLSIVICLAFVVLYQYMLGVFYPDYGKPIPEAQNLPERQTRTDHVSTTPPKAASLPSADVTEEMPEDNVIPVMTRQYDMGISELYGSITSIKLRDYTDYEKKQTLQFLDAEDPRYGIGGYTLWVNGRDVGVSGSETLSGSSRVETTFTHEGVYFSKKIVFDKALYGNEISISIQNRGGETKDIQLELSAGSGLVSRSTIDRQYLEANWIRDDELQHPKSPGTGKTKSADTPYRAASIKTRHFSSILEPLDGRPWTPMVRGLNGHDFASGMITGSITLAPGETWDSRVFLFIGPNSVEALKPFQLEEVVNFGKLDTICKFLLGGLQLMHKITRNYGLAIIILTIAMNLLLLPLTRASFMSMRRMQLVQPQMAKLKEKYKKDPQKMNKEMMELYKKHKVNPMGGCLPMLLQMPIFIALYVTLSKATELLGAKFLWVNDLASPDRVPLPFSLPLVGDNLHVLPLIMVGAMVVQQRLSASQMQTADPQAQQMQKMMLYMLPVMFGFIFYPMPSGLVIYWLTNTVTMSSYQMYLKKTMVIQPAR